MARAHPFTASAWSHRWGRLSRAADLDPEEPVLLALSGGADSVFLLHVLACAHPRPPVRAAYVDHGLRPRETPAERRFCERLCRSLGVPFTALAVDLDAGSADLEARAREARYRALSDEAARAGIGTILTGHHADDALETLLMRWIRGTPLPGLAGLRRRTVLGDLCGARAREAGPIVVVRPLVGMRREEVRHVLSVHGLAWCEDSSNRDRRFARNRVRHDLLPELEASCGLETLSNLRDFVGAIERLEDAFAAATAHISWAPAAYASATRAPRSAPLGGTLARSELMRLPAPLRRRALWRLLLEGSGRAPGRRLLELLHDDLAGGRCARHTLPGGWRLRLRSKLLHLHPPVPDRPAFSETEPGEDVGSEPLLPFPSIKAVAVIPRAGRRTRSRARSFADAPIATHAGGRALQVPGVVELPDGRRITAAIVVRSSGSPVPRAPHIAELDWNGTPARLWVRWPVPGDRFQGLGAPGSRRLSRFLADLGIAREERDRVPLVFADSELIWVAGVRPSHARRVHGGTTQRLRLTLGG